LDESLQAQKSTDENNEPWELEESGEEKLKPIPTMITQKHDSYNNFLSDTYTSAPMSSLTTATTEESEDEENNDENGNENYDSYFSKYQPTEMTESIEPPSTKTVRFNDNLQNIAVITPKDSLEQSESSSSSTTTSDSDETDNEYTPSNVETNHNHFNEKETNNNNTNEVTMRSVIPRPESNISLTESEDLPPPLPPLPPLNNKPSNFLLFLNGIRWIY
jgi:hypothetical protein